MYTKYKPFTLSFVNVRTTFSQCSTPPSTVPSVDKTVVTVPNLFVQTIGDKVPEWRKKVATGVNASSSYSRIEKSADVALGKMRADIVCNKTKNLTAWTELDGSYVLRPTTTGSLDTTRASNDAKMSFIHDVKRGYNSISGGVFLGELRETLDMIRNPAKGLRIGCDTWLERVKKLVRSYRHCRSRPDLCRDRLNADIASLWLEYAFGWAPLISDTKAGAEALARLIHGEIRHTTVRGSGSDEDNDWSSQLVTPTGMPPGWRIVNTINHTRRVRVFYYGQVRAKAQGPTLENAMYLFGFSAEEFVPTIWNLLPWSFLVDYFVNIGDVLEASFFDTASVSWASRSEVTENLIGSHGYLVEHTKSLYRMSGSPGAFYYRDKTFTRASDAGDLVPAVEVSLPGSPQKWFNMAALAASVTDLQSKLSKLAR